MRFPGCVRRVPIWARGKLSALAPLRRIDELEVAVRQLRDIFQYETSANEPPPKHLQVRVVGSYHPQFIESGYRAVSQFNVVLESVGTSFDRFDTIYDFGCGCGRVARAVKRLYPSSHLYGSDIDEEAIAWLQTHNRAIGEFRTNLPMPPTGYDDEIFDLVYSVSILTHLPEKMQFAWLGELERVAKRGAYLILTTHGEKHWRKLSPTQQEVMLDKGFYYIDNDKPTTEGLPAFYQTAFHTHEYIRQEWTRYFEIMGIHTLALDNHQDVVLLRKR